MYHGLFGTLGEVFGTISKKLREFIGVKIGNVRGICYPESWIGLYKVSLAHPSWWDKLESWFLIARHHSLCLVI